MFVDKLRRGHCVRSVGVGLLPGLGLVDLPAAAVSSGVRYPNV